MFDFHEKRKVRNILYSKGAILAVTVIAVLMAYAVYGAYEKEKETRAVKEDREEVLGGLHERKEVLAEEIDRLSTERGVEAEIRGKFEVAKEGEEVLVIVEPPEEEAVPVVEEEKPGFFKRLFGG